MVQRKKTASSKTASKRTASRSIKTSANPRKVTAKAELGMSAARDSIGEELDNIRKQNIVEAFVNTSPIPQGDTALKEYCRKEIREFERAKTEFERKHRILRQKIRQHEVEKITRLIGSSDIPLSLWMQDPDEKVRTIAERIALERRRAV